MAGATRVCCVQCPAPRAGPRRKREQVQITEGQRANEGDGLLELGFGFAGKAHHDVGAQGQLRAGGAQQRGNLFGVVPGAVAAVHAAQHGVGAGLQRQMRVARQALLACIGTGELGHQADQLVGPSPWARWS